MMPIWERYFLRETLKIFFLCLFSFYGLYILIDYANHSSSFHYHHSWFKWSELIRYYLYEFSNRLDVLLPFALLIATIQTLCSLTIHHELVALMAGGFNLKTLMRPFVMLGLLCTLIVFLNTEIIQPKATRELRHIDDLHTTQKNKRNKLRAVEHISLKDNTTMIFQGFDSVKQRFYDAYWIKSIDEIYRIKYLYPSKPIPTGFHVEYLLRTDSGELTVKETFKKKAFPNIRFNKKTLLETITPDEERSLSILYKELSKSRNQLTEKDARRLSVFYRKLAVPWLCLLAVIGPIPFCVRFTRQLPVFFIYACSIFGLVGCYLIIDAATVIGKRQVLSPAVAIWPPISLFFGYFIWRFVRVK